MASSLATRQTLVVVSVLLVLCLGRTSDARNPGISLRLAEPVFTYVLNQIVNPLVEKELSVVKIPDVQYHISGLNFDIFLTELRFLNTTYQFQPQSFLQPNANLTALEAKFGFAVEGQGRWRTRARWWPYITESGDVYFYTRPMWLQVAISMKPGADGLWNFSMVEFYADCNLDIKFTGDGMSGIDVGALRKYISEQANKAVNVEVSTQITKFLKDLTPMMAKYLPYVSYKNCTRFSIPDCQDFALNLSLSSGGLWKQNCSAEIQLDGYLLYDKQAFLPVPAQPFPAEVGCGQHTIGLYLSGGTFSSVVAAILGSGLVHGNFPTHKYTNDSYYVQFIPGLKKYGYLPLYTNLTLLNTTMVITQNEMRVMLAASFHVLVDTTPAKLLPDKTFVQAVDMVVETTVGLTAWLKNLSTPDGMMSLLFLNFSTAIVNGVTVNNSTVGPVDVTKVHTLMQQLLETGFNNADEFLTKGILILPKHVGAVALQHPQLIIGEGYLKLAIDVGENVPPSTSPPVSPDYLFMDDSDVWQKKMAQIDIEHVPKSIPDAVGELFDSFLEFQVRLARIMRTAFRTFAEGACDMSN